MKLQLVLQCILFCSVFAIKYPIVFSTVRNLNLASSQLLNQIGIEGNINSYNIISLDGWTSMNGLKGAIQLWNNPSKYLTNQKYGLSNQEKQKAMKAVYQSKGIQIIAHAFSDNQYPFSSNLDPIVTASKLSDFILKSNLDGVAIQITQRSAIANQSNSVWILNFTKTLRDRLPQKIICYQQFPTDFLPNMAFNPIIQQLSSLIDFVIIKYYNFLSPDYRNYSSIFMTSQYYPNTSVKSLIQLGLLANQIVVGKPSSDTDSYSPNFYVGSSILQSSFSEAYRQLAWYGGYANNDYFNDKNGTYAQVVMMGIRNQCLQSGMCI